MPPIALRRSWRNRKITCISSNFAPNEVIVLPVRAGLKLHRLERGESSNCLSESGSLRLDIAIIRMAGARNWTIIRGVKIFFEIYADALLSGDLIVYEDAPLGLNLEGGGGRYA